MRVSIVGVVLLACTLGLYSGAASGQVPQQVVNIVVDEYGSGTLEFVGVGQLPMPGFLIPDPTQPALPSGDPVMSLGFNMLGPTGIVEGDLIILEADGTTSDVIRFTSSLEVPGMLPGPGFFFYSDTEPGGDTALADTGLPAVTLPNSVTVTELGFEGGFQWVDYHPGPNQPGYVPPDALGSWDVSYRFISDGVIPLPAAAWMGLALLGVVVVRRRLART